MSPNDMLWVSSHLVGGSIAVFFAVVQVLSAFRQKPPRRRELWSSLVLFCFGGVGLMWWVAPTFDLPAILIWLGPLQMTLTWFFLCVMTSDKRWLVPSGVVVALLVALDLAGVEPLAFIVRSDRPSSPLAAAVHCAYVTVVSVAGCVHGARAMRAGESDLRWLIFGAPGIVLLYYFSVLAAVGVVEAPQPAGIIALTAAVTTTWWRLERVAVLAKKEATPTLELGGYRLLDRIGQGGMAEVFLGERVGPGGFKKRVAIKRMLPQMLEDEASTTMFLDEARLAARLSHENIVTIHELGAENGSYFLIMEFLEGLPLSKLRRRGICFDVDVVVAAGAQLLSGLAYAHGLKGDDDASLGLVHRDISPQNLMIDTRGNVRILDFGIARAAGRSTRTETGAIKGKVPYMAPEQLDTDLALDGRADVYAAAVVLCELACGHRPLEGDDLSSLTKLVRKQVPPPQELATTSQPLRGILERALLCDRDQRTASAQALREELLAIPGVDVEKGKQKLGALVAEALHHRAGAASEQQQTPTSETTVNLRA